MPLSHDIIIWLKEYELLNHMYPKQLLNNDKTRLNKTVGGFLIVVD